MSDLWPDLSLPPINLWSLPPWQDFTDKTKGKPVDKTMRIDAAAFNMEPNGDESDPRSELLGTVIINHVHFHVEAFAADTISDEKKLEIQDLNGDDCQTVKIMDREYYLVIYPYAP